MRKVRHCWDTSICVCVWVHMGDEVGGDSGAHPKAKAKAKAHLKDHAMSLHQALLISTRIERHTNFRERTSNT